MAIWNRIDVPALAKPALRLFERDVLTAYPDSGGVWTEGTGSTVDPEGRPVRAGDHVTQAQDDAMLDHELTQIRIPAILRVIPARVPLTDEMAAMLCSFVYNEGVGALAPGNVITEMLAAGLLVRGFAQLPGWCIGTSQGVRGPMVGLLRRRRVEMLGASGAPLQETYEAVWKLTEPELIGLYSSACSDAAAYRNGRVTWEVHSVPAAAVAHKPSAAPTASAVGESEADALMDRMNPGA